MHLIYPLIWFHTFTKTMNAFLSVTCFITQPKPYKKVCVHSWDIFWIGSPWLVPPKKRVKQCSKLCKPAPESLGKQQKAWEISRIFPLWVSSRWSKTVLLPVLFQTFLSGVYGSPLRKPILTLTCHCSTSAGFELFLPPWNLFVDIHYGHTMPQWGPSHTCCECRSKAAASSSSVTDGLIRFMSLRVFRVSTVQFFTLKEGEEKIVPHSRLSLPHCPVDMTFDPEGRLWVLMDSRDSPVRMYSHRQDSWEVRCHKFRFSFLILVSDTRRGFESLVFVVSKRNDWNQRKGK